MERKAQPCRRWRQGWTLRLNEGGYYELQSIALYRGFASLGMCHAPRKLCRLYGCTWTVPRAAAERHPS